MFADIVMQCECSVISVRLPVLSRPKAAPALQIRPLARAIARVEPVQIRIMMLQRESEGFAPFCAVAPTKP